jgi:hypothetical protein
VSNLVKGLAETGFKKNYLPEDCSQSLLKEVLRIWNQMNDEQIDIIILG